MVGKGEVLDSKTLNELGELLEEGLAELLHAYLDDTPDLLLRLRSAIESDDAGAIASVAHTLKGSSGNLGVTGLYELSLALEQEAKAGVVADSHGALRSIEKEFDRAKEALQVYLT